MSCTLESLFLLCINLYFDSHSRIQSIDHMHEIHLYWEYQYNDQSVCLIPKMGSRDYKFLNPGCRD